jgi:hypothetical protein
MRRLPRRTRSAACALLAALLLPVARAGGADPPAPAGARPTAAALGDGAPASTHGGASTHGAHGDCAPLPGPAADTPPRAIARNGVNLASDLFGRPHAPGTVRVCVLVDESGLVREARALGDGSALDSIVAASAGWWLFEPARLEGKPVPATLVVEVGLPSARDVEPLAPDVLAMAVEAEARGDVRGAIDAWTGVLARVGSHPSLGDGWSVRGRILDLAARLSPRPVVPLSVDGRGRGARNMMQRNIARPANEDYARTLDQVLLAAPWYVDAYRWRAAACAASGRRQDAIRDALCYRRAAPDSASRALADRALRALAAGDTLSANSLLKN